MIFYQKYFVSLVDVSSVSRSRRVTLDVICMITCWAIWKVRNLVVFNNGLFGKKKLKELSDDKSFDWFVNMNKKVYSNRKPYAIFVIF